MWFLNKYKCIASNTPGAPGQSSSSSGASSTQSDPNNTNAPNKHKDSNGNVTYEDLLTNEKSIKELASQDERRKLFLKKLQLCGVLFDFTQNDTVRLHFFLSLIFILLLSFVA